MQVDGTEQTAFTGMYNKPVGNQDLGKTEFLSLLVTQLKHQDPLQPMDNTAFVAQLAQFSNVEQLVAVNEGINILGMQQMSASNAQAATLIGREVEVRSDAFSVGANDTEIGAAFSLQGDASDVKVHIRDSSGNVVRTIELGARAKGEIGFNWDIRDKNGVKMPTGTYRIDVVAVDTDGGTITWEPKVKGIVDGVTYDKGYPELVLGDVKAQMSDIIGVFPATGMVP